MFWLDTVKLNIAYNNSIFLFWMKKKVITKKGLYFCHFYSKYFDLLLIDCVVVFNNTQHKIVLKSERLCKNLYRCYFKHCLSFYLFLRRMLGSIGMKGSLKVGEIASWTQNNWQWERQGQGELKVHQCWGSPSSKQSTYLIR